MTRNGRAFRRRLWVPATGEIGGGALPTPKASDGERGRDKARTRPDTKGRELATVVRDQMLPTPSAGLHNYDEAPESFMARRERLKAKGINGNGAGIPLGVAVKLLPTPRTCSAMASRLDTAGNQEGKRFPNLETVIASQLLTPCASDWKGRTNWQAAGRNGPQRLSDSLPTGGGMHLNPFFVEEMMGFPVGWTA